METLKEIHKKRGIVMKKALLVSLTLVLMVSMSISSVAEDKLLISQGDYNETVKTLHQKLADLGYYGLRPESPWSEASADALKILQENLDWDITGTVESKEQIDEILAIESVIGKNLLLGTNQGTKNYKILDQGFNATLESPDGVGVKVTSTSRDDSGWLVLFFDDERSRKILAEPAGAWFTLSFEARSNVENAEVRISHRQTNAGENQMAFGTVKLRERDVWQRYCLSGQLNGTVATSQGLYFDMRYGNPAGTEIEIRNLKLEKGSRATEWSKAPED